MIPFNIPYTTGKELQYIQKAIQSGHISGNGSYTKMCQEYFEARLGIRKALLTTSCTDALEMCALLLNIDKGDEVIVPSYTFVSSALAFVRQGAKIIFADSRGDHPGVDEDQIEQLISSKTKAIIIVHYAGVACDMDKIMSLSEKYHIPIVEDAAQSIDSFYVSKAGDRKALGSIGHLAAFSFHETKNIQCGEGGLLAINDLRFLPRAEIIWEKGTNRAKFFRGEVNKYGWVDTGSSFLPSEILAAFLWAQIEAMDSIQQRRKEIWNIYNRELLEWAAGINVKLPKITDNASNNAHMFYLICSDLEQRTSLIRHLKNHGIMAVFHYQSLHASEYYRSINKDRDLNNANYYSSCLLRLPLYFSLKEEDIWHIIDSLKAFS